MQPRGTSHFPSYRRPDAKISSADLSADIAAFEGRGGHIEKLGNTPTFKSKLKSHDTAATPAGDSPSDTP